MGIIDFFKRLFTRQEIGPKIIETTPSVSEQIKTDLKFLENRDGTKSRYSKEEDDFVIKCEDTAECRELAKKLGRSEGSVRARRDKLLGKFNNKKPSRKKSEVREFSERDDHFILNAKMTDREIGKRLNRSASSIRSRRHKLVNKKTRRR